MDRHYLKRGFRRSISWSAKPAADHDLQIADARGRQCWRMAGRDRSGIQEPCCIDTCTPERTAGTESGHWHPASVKHGVGNGSVLDCTCHSLTRPAQLRWEHVATWLSSFLASRPVDRHSGRRGWRRTREPVWRRSRHLAIRTSDTA